MRKNLHFFSNKAIMEDNTVVKKPYSGKGCYLCRFGKRLFLE